MPKFTDIRKQVVAFLPISFAFPIARLLSKSGDDRRNVLKFLRTRTLRAIIWRLALRSDLLLQVGYAREQIAKDRAKILLKDVRTAPEAGRKIVSGAVQYNLAAAETAPDLDRPMAMTNIVTSIDRIHKNRADLDVLSVGPRSEIEIFGLMAAGFLSNRIKALDLISYSPFVDLGDAHEMPYADNSFDVVTVGWVLRYSSDREQLASEIVRVCRNRAIVAIAGDWSENKVVSTDSTTQVLDLFTKHVKQVFFRHEPDPPETETTIVVFEITK